MHKGLIAIIIVILLLIGIGTAGYYAIHNFHPSINIETGDGRSVNIEANGPNGASIHVTDGAGRTVNINSDNKSNTITTKNNTSSVKVHMTNSTSTNSGH